MGSFTPFNTSPKRSLLPRGPGIGSLESASSSKISGVTTGFTPTRGLRWLKLLDIWHMVFVWFAVCCLLVVCCTSAFLLLLLFPFPPRLLLLLLLLILIILIILIILFFSFYSFFLLMFLLLLFLLLLLLLLALVVVVVATVVGSDGCLYLLGALPQKFRK